MRAKQFIFEYKRDKTAQALGAALVKKALHDPMMKDIASSAMATATQAILDGVKIPPDAAQYITNKVLAKLEDADPTPQKKYTLWLAKEYARSNDRLEDMISTYADYLETYHTLKIKNILPTEHKDINKHTIGTMVQTVEHYQDQLEDEKQIDKGESEVVYEDDQVRIISPHDQEAACYYGQGTKWCTAAKRNNMFSGYHSNGDLYIVLPKKPQYTGEKYQLWFGDGESSPQFMNERDHSISIVELVYQFGKKFEKFFLEQEKEGMEGILAYMPDDILLDHIKSVAIDWNRGYEDKSAAQALKREIATDPDKVVQLVRNEMYETLPVSHEYTWQDLVDSDMESTLIAFALELDEPQHI